MENNTLLQEHLLICIGNEFRQDDGVGPFIGRHLKAMGLDGIRILENAGDPMALMDAWKNEETVILVDAVRSGQPAGTIFYFDAVADPMPEDIFSVSSHDVSIPECVALSRSLDIFPEKLLFYGIEGESFGQGEHLSPAVMESAWLVAEKISKALRNE